MADGSIERKVADILAAQSPQPDPVAQNVASILLAQSPLVPDTTITPDYTSQYNTQLSPQDEQTYQVWAAQNGRENDSRDYDMRGAWQAQVDQAGNGHYPDTYKKPNHPTFSVESQYSNPQALGGMWADMGNDKWSYTPSSYNLNTFGLENLQNYFGRVEPEATLVIPPPYKVQR